MTAAADITNLPDVGDSVGNYVIEEKLGEGGFGVVFGARHSVTRKRVAIKLLNADLAAYQPEILIRFRREASAGNEIGHENFVEAYDFGDYRGSPYIVMEYLKGVSLWGEVRKSGPLPVQRLAAILAQAADAIGAAHARGIIHRDIKPENIFLVSRGGNHDFVKILDLGIAKFVGDAAGDDAKFRTHTKAILGSPYTMSPEQCRGADIDHRSDIYSLGAVAFFLGTGRYPFEGEYPGDIMIGHVRDAPPLMSSLAPTSAAIDQVVDRALAKRPDDRFHSAMEFGEALVAASRSAGLVALPSDMAPTRLTPIVSMPAAAAAAVPAAAAIPAAAAVTAPPATTKGAQAGAKWLLGISLLVAAGAGTFVVVKLMGNSSSTPLNVVAAETPATGEPGIKRAAVDQRKPAPAAVVEPEKVPATVVEVQKEPAAVTEPNSVHVTPPAPMERGRLTINVDPWATVLIDGRKAGDTPLSNISLPAGPHVVALINSDKGHPRARPLEKKVVIRAGHPVIIDLDWTR